MAQTFTREEVSKHTSPDSLWCIIDSRVYNLTDFLDAHPGGNVLLQQIAGRDATTDFYNLHRQEVLYRYAPKLLIGTIAGETPVVAVDPPAPGSLSTVPYAEPLWLSPAYKSPYYNDSHHRLRAAIREYVDSELFAEAQARERDGEPISAATVARMSEINLIAMRLGPGKHLHGLTLPGGVRGEEFNAFHDLVVAQEMVRARARGFQDGNLAGLMISLTAVNQWANNQELKDRVNRECLSGKRLMSLAVTEAFAGSDVAGIRTTAEKTPEGDYIINGTKKWITNGTFAEYFVVACRTPKGHSVFLVERGDNVETKKIKTAYSTTAGTAFIQFDNVRVPASHLLGPEHRGFGVIMSNFNHERWVLVAMVARSSRTVVEECLLWCNQRTAFGKSLTAQPVIRAKLARMISLVEAVQSWLETITYQMASMDYSRQSKLLGGPIGLLKTFATRAAHEIADDAVNIFGGRGLTQSGMGRYVEEFHRTYKFDAILGGTEEILADLGVRQALKAMPASAKL